MNKRQTEVEKAKLADEEKVLNNLQKQYGRALKDINSNVKDLQHDIKDLTAELEHAIEIGDTEYERIIQSRIQSKVYQKGYQEALKKQIDGIVDNMNKSQYKSIQGYLNGCYDSGYIGTMYDIAGQGIPLIVPIDQKAVTKAITLDSKVSKKLYGSYVTDLKKKIQAEISRGISTGLLYNDIARNLKNQTKIGLNKAMRIVRTEGHRIQQVSADDARQRAKDAGADVVKQWDSTIDKNTRESHAKVDGEIRELDDTFSNGLKFAGDPAGGASEVVNCRCATLQRAKWALDEGELDTLKERAEYFGIDKTKNFEDFKEKYLKAAEEVDKPIKNVIEFAPAKTITEAEQYAKSNFVIESTWSGNGNITYKGLSVESANRLNEELTYLFSEYDVPKFNNMGTMNFRKSEFKDLKETPMCYKNMNSGEMYFNQNILKNSKSLEKYFDEGKAAFEKCKNNIDFFKGSQRELIETYVTAGRSLVSEDAKDGMKAMLDHEFGHHIQNQIIFNSKEMYEITKGGFDEYAPKLSGYATKTLGEYIAESYSAYMNGEIDRIDPKLAKVFEGVQKNE